MATNWETPEAVGLARGDVSALASKVADDLGYEPGESLEPIVERLGGEILYGDLTDEASDSGSICITPKGFVIHIPLDTSLLRDRFTIAHELGHYVLHYLYQKQVNHRDIVNMRAQRYGSGQVEYEANWFAAAFLMPAAKFREKHSQFDGSEIAISDYFKVSTQAARVRAKSLGLG